MTRKKPTVELRKIGELTPDEHNANRGTERGAAMITRSIEKNGAGRSILLDKHGRIIAGNKTHAQAGALGIEDVIIVQSDGTKLVAVMRTDLDLETDVAARELAYADNRTALLDIDLDPEQIARDRLAGVDLDDWFSAEEIAGILASLNAEPVTDESEIPDAQIDRADELAEKWGTKRGQLWSIGRHRLLCGDATSADDVEQLLNGATPALMVTDPPYGVEYDPSWRSGAGLNRGGRMGKVANDDRADWTDAWLLSPARVAYCWHAGVHASSVYESLSNAGFELRSQIIWAKNHLVLSRGHYHWQHEPCWYAVRKGATAEWIGDRSQSTLWSIPIKDGDDQASHGTQKPIECMRRPLRNHAGDVYDPFCGSGTTIVAAELEGRSCFAMELEPKYVAVILERLSQMGLTPTLAAQGNPAEITD